MKNRKNINSIILAELWENAVFNDKAYTVLEKIITKIAKAENPSDVNNAPLPSSESSYILSTIRNRNLISDDDQDKLRNTVVSFFGLSVGSNAATAWMLESRADQIKIIDPDTVSPSNLNRLLYGWDSVGKKKIELMQERLLQIHPYVDVITSTEKDTRLINSLVSNNPKVDVIVDAMDDLAAKVEVRKIARSKNIPVIMVTDIGDNIAIDIERYDRDPQPELFLGKVPGIENMNLSELSFAERLKLVFTIVGFEKNSEEMLESLLAIGKSLATWPQLGATAMIAGGTIATIIKKIVLGEDVKSGRYYLSLDDVLVADCNTEEKEAIRNILIDKVKNRFSL